MNGRYEILDGLRGATAVMVVAHCCLDAIGLPGVRAPHAALVLDFIFCLSGFVLTHAYGGMLGTRLSFGDFYATRWIRLFPMLTFGLFAGVVVLLAKLALRDETGATWTLQSALPLVVFPWPSTPFSMDATRSSFGHLSQWSLLLQIVVSLAFPWLLRAGDRILIVVMGLSGIVVATGALGHQNVHGYDAWTGMAVELTRVIHPVTVGVFLCRLVSRMPRRPPESIPRCAGLVVSLVVLLAVPMPMALTGVYEAVAGLFLLPMLMLYAASSTPPAALKPVMLWLGAVSYPVYAIHFPIVRAVSETIGRLDPMPDWQCGLVVAAATGACLAVAWIVLEKVDQPIRRWMTRRYIDARIGADEPFAQVDTQEFLPPHGIAAHDAPGARASK
jgi:peptidoglycan/LPS O-acetylase OafA/YrhL